MDFHFIRPGFEKALIEMGLFVAVLDGMTAINFGVELNDGNDEQDSKISLTPRLSIVSNQTLQN